MKITPTDIHQVANDTLVACRSHGWRISLAESCTGGLVMGALTEIAGSSDVVDRGFVTYSNDAKMDMLGVSAKTLHDFGAVSNETALEMAQGAHDRSLANISVSITGIAGPGGSEHKPEGMVCFGIATDNQSPTAVTKQFGAIGRSSVRMAATLFALNLLLEHAANKQLPQK